MVALADEEPLVQDGELRDDIDLTDFVGPVNLALDLDGSNLYRVIGGLSLTLGPVLLAGDINFGKVRTASMSLGVAF